MGNGVERKKREEKEKREEEKVDHVQEEREGK